MLVGVVGLTMPLGWRVTDCIDFEKKNSGTIFHDFENQ
jgi:hypothetical protein